MVSGKVIYQPPATVPIRLWEYKTSSENNNLKILDEAITFKYSVERRREVHLAQDTLLQNQGCREPVAEYIAELAERNDKDSRIKLKKLRDYIKFKHARNASGGALYKAP